MSASLKYVGTGAALVAITILALWPVLDADGRTGVLVAAGVALPVQIVAFVLLVRFRSTVNGFLAVWAGGTLVRMGILAVVATVAIRSQMDGAIPMLLALAGFFFALLLIEPLYLRPDGVSQPEAT